MKPNCAPEWLNMSYLLAPRALPVPFSAPPGGTYSVRRTSSDAVAGLELSTLSRQSLQRRLYYRYLALNFWQITSVR